LLKTNKKLILCENRKRFGEFDVGNLLEVIDKIIIKKKVDS
jgi:hypothetical protein